MEQVIHVFHGFLGTPEDFSFLKGEGVLVHDIYDLKRGFEISSKDTLIGYSMGGRIALDLAKRINYQLEKIVLINAHPGLSTQEERQNRKHFEDNVLLRLQTNSKDEFIKYWNNLPIFEFDSPIEVIDQERFQQSARIFDLYRLSNQENHLETIQLLKEKCLWLIGTEDAKYMSLAQELLLPRGIRVKTLQGGHRLFQRPELIKKILQEEHIL